MSNTFPVRDFVLAVPQPLVGNGRDPQCVQRVMLFDLSTHGHHAAYIKHLICYWRESKLAGELLIVVSPKFTQAHADVVGLADGETSARVKFVAISPTEESALNSRSSRIDRVLRNVREWKLLHQYAVFLEATHCLLMYLDTCELPLVLGSSLPCPFSGIYFRPTFHYSTLAGDRPSSKEYLQRWRERFFLMRTLNHSKLRTLFCLDPLVVNHLRPGSNLVRVVPLPDPVKVVVPAQACLETIRSQLDGAAGRQVILLFGSFEAKRKGVYKLLDAIALLTPELCQKLCVLIVGSAGVEEQVQIDIRVKALCQKQSVQVITRFEFISDDDVAAYFQLAYAALAIYQRHAGMSGILLLAAAAQKPILSSNYGLMGELVRRYQLGLTVDSTSPSEIAVGLTRLLTEPAETLSDRAQMEAFVAQNSAKKFAETIFQQLQSSSP